MILSEDSFKNWIPYKLLRNNDDLKCEWLYVGDEPFLEPFFDSTIARCKQLPENFDHYKNVTALSTMLEWSAKVDAAEPAGFIFHVSRCGSTMVSQLLSMHTEHIVLSEVPFFDDILRMPQIEKYTNAELFKGAVKLYSQKKTGSEKKVFIKTDSWHIRFHKEIREMFPEIVFLLLYRRPDEVVRSLNRAAGMHCVPQFIDPQFFGIPDKVVTIPDFYDYPVKVIGKYLETYLEVAATDPNLLLLNYNEGMLPIIEKIGNRVGIIFSVDEQAKMKERLLFQGKQPQLYFSPEPAIDTISDKFSGLFELYDRIEKIKENMLPGQIF